MENFQAVIAEMIKFLNHYKLHRSIKKIYEALGSEADLYLVGGVVREAFFQKKAKDIDLATILRPLEIQNICKKKKIKFIPTGLDHGTITVLIDGEHIEITTFRSPSSRSKSNFSDSILTDLSGRDFTINAIAFSLNKSHLIDPHNGIEHLVTQKLVCVGDPITRFLEDPHRILRALRFGPGQERLLSDGVEKSIKKLAAQIHNISVERVREEFLNILLSPNPKAAFLAARDLGVLEFLLPEILPTVDFEQNKYHFEDVFEHILSVVEATKQDKLIRLAALFHDIGKPQSLTVGDDGERHFYCHEIIGAEITQTAMSRLRFSKQEIEQVSKLVKYHMRPLICGAPAVRRLNRDLGELIYPWLSLKRADKSPLQQVKDFANDFQSFKSMLDKELNHQDYQLRSKLAINGTDLKKLGIPAGPFMGEILAKLKEHIMDYPEDNTLEKLKVLVKELV
jgi:tRNA nucleotidyltransferase (CCA-adding enzyme)